MVVPLSRAQIWSSGQVSPCLQSRASPGRQALLLHVTLAGEGTSQAGLMGQSGGSRGRMGSYPLLQSRGPPHLLLRSFGHCPCPSVAACRPAFLRSPRLSTSPPPEHLTGPAARGVLCPSEASSSSQGSSWPRPLAASRSGDAWQAWRAPRLSGVI